MARMGEKQTYPAIALDLATRINKALKHISHTFHWFGLTSRQHVAVYWHVRGYSASRIGKLMGKSRHSVRKYLEQAVRKINACEDWEITIRDLADVLFKLIQEELDGNTNQE